MKRISILNIILFFSSGLYSQGFYDSIPNAQLHAINVSPYGDAKGGIYYINSQKVFREKEYPVLIKKLLLKKQKLTDTLWLVEEFWDECFGCQSFQTRILYNDTLYIIKRPVFEIASDYTRSKLVFSEFQTDSEFVTKHHEIFEVRSRINKKKSWQSDSLKYGQDGCNDGTHTLLTILFPNETVESLYVRCWDDWIGKTIE